MLLHFEITDDSFVCKDSTLANESINVDYIKCQFDFKSKAWKDVDAKVAVFKSASYGISEEVLLDNSDSGYIPSEVYKHGGIIQIVLYGDSYAVLSDGNQRKTTNLSAVMELYISPNIIVPVPTPYKYENFTAEYVNAQRELKNIIDNLSDMVESGAFDGVGISEITFNDDYTATVTLDDGRQFTSGNLRGEIGATGATGVDGPPGEPGEPGEDGNGIESITKTGTVDLVDTYTISYTNGDSDTFTVTNGRNAIGGDAFFQIVETPYEIGTEGDPDYDYGWELDKTYAEILSAYNNGQLPIITSLNVFAPTTDPVGVERLIWYCVNITEAEDNSEAYYAVEAFGDPGTRWYEASTVNGVLRCSDHN